ncbi:aspartokinase [Odoribacter laneus]|jgi:aspartate kinase|uniref:aspartate kinase n=1 Tax=Odoribacter laneus TaxID=626933 RepID=UPI00189741D0|nr:aspartate kinase [Odoribacter laneus]GKI21617.1 aspartokinase [Odoribacter laneus]GKI26199.1 aspartokinase [Odoribacter laneus]
MKVLKFGGTSVGSAERIRAVAHLIDDGQPKIVVLSAMSGTTNTLIEMANCLYRDEKQKAIDILQNLELNYYIVISELYATESSIHKAKEFIQTVFTYLRSFVNKDFYPLQEKAVVAQGEIISTTLMYYYLQECGIPSSLMSALNYMRIDKDGEPDYFYIEQNLKRELSQPDVQPLIITQGFICRNAYGEIDNLKRGGSDYSAALVGAALRAEEIQIWTDIDGVHNNDPRFVEKTRAIRQLSFDEAAELAYFGAKILHPSSIQPAKKENIPVRLKNTLHPEDEGTLITKESPVENVKAVAAKDGITAINVKSTNMLLAYGFLRKVFEVFEAWKTPIDMIATSEVAVSLTIDCTDHLENILKDLEKFGTIEVDTDLSIICIVGAFAAGKTGLGARVLNALTDVPLRMISYGGSEHNISLLVKREDKQKALVDLSHKLLDIESESMF